MDRELSSQLSAFDALHYDQWHACNDPLSSILSPYSFLCASWVLRSTSSSFKVCMGAQYLEWHPHPVYHTHSQYTTPTPSILHPHPVYHTHSQYMQYSLTASHTKRGYIILVHNSSSSLKWRSSCTLAIHSSWRVVTSAWSYERVNMKPKTNTHSGTNTSVRALPSFIWSVYVKTFFTTWKHADLYPKYDL